MKVLRGRFASAVALAVAMVTLVVAQGGQGRGGGQPAVFRTDVPVHDLDVIQARPTDTSVTMSLLAAKDVTVTLSYQPGGAPRQIALKAGVPFSVDITGLAPNQSYRYSVADGQTTRATGTFRTAPSPGSRFTFAVQADSHLDGNTDPRIYERTLANIAADAPHFLIDLGDTFMTEKYQSYQDSGRQYLAQRYYLGLVGRTMPVFLVIGNHDGEAGWRARGGGDVTAWAAAMRRKYFPPIESNRFYSAGPSGTSSYAFTWGDALLVVLDPFSATLEKPRDANDGWAWTLGKAQYDWLAATLASSKAPVRFVFIHHLVGGGTREARGGAEASVFFEWGGANRDGSKGFAARRPGWPMPIHDLLVSQRVVAVFHGHDHLYVRQERDGMVYQEVPQPGHSRGEPTGSAKEYGYLSGTVLGSSGHVRVSVAAAGAVVEYVRSRLAGGNGEVADRYTLRPAGGRSDDN
jgi:hypothetical protein